MRASGRTDRRAQPEDPAPGQDVRQDTSIDQLVRERGNVSSGLLERTDGGAETDADYEAERASAAEDGETEVALAAGEVARQNADGRGHGARRTEPLKRAEDAELDERLREAAGEDPDRQPDKAYTEGFAGNVRSGDRKRRDMLTELTSDEAEKSVRREAVSPCLIEDFKVRAGTSDSQQLLAVAIGQDAGEKEEGAKGEPVIRLRVRLSEVGVPMLTVAHGEDVRVG
jgi:hypothetical protein